MVRIISADQSVQDFADGILLQHRNDPEVGLIVGRHVAGKDYVLQVVRTPHQVDEAPIKELKSSMSNAKKKGSGAASRPSQIALDQDWIIEHATQMNRIMAGGLKILGVYVISSSSAFQSSHGVMVNLLREVYRELPPISGSFVPFVITFDVATSQISAREVDGGALRPCEIKIAPVLSAMMMIGCHYDLFLRINLCNQRQQVHNSIRSAIRWEKSHVLDPSQFLVNGRLVPSDKIVMDVAKDGASVGDMVSVEWLFPLGHDSAPSMVLGNDERSKADLDKGESIHYAVLELRGQLDCRAYVHKREKISSAVQALKDDIQDSLLARLDVIVEAAEMVMESLQDTQPPAAIGGSTESKRCHPLLLRVSESGPYTMRLPRRAFVGWKNGMGCYCDYLISGEGAKEAMQRLNELVGDDKVDPAAFVCLESEACDTDHSQSRTADGKSIFALDARLLSIVGALLIVVLALLLARNGAVSS